MELTNQDKEIGASATLGYTLPNRSSSSCSELSPSSAVGERRDATAHFHEIFAHTSPTLDHHHLYNLPSPSPRQSSLIQQSHRPRRDPDPATAPITATSINTTAVVCGSKSRAAASAPEQPAGGTIPLTTNTASIKPLIRYRECLKNHAASTGGHVVDGCGEFMPGGEEGTPEAIKCAACECHRNFHRKEIEGDLQHVPSYCHVPNKNNDPRDGLPSYHPSHNLQPQFPPTTVRHMPRHKFFHCPPATSGGLFPPMMMTFGGASGAATESSSEDLNMFLSDAGRQTFVQPAMSKKRFRTKFTKEQKDKMMEFAEKLGWRIQKNDEQEVQQFCVEVGVKKQVFKVWMHNNKQAMKKKQM